MTFSPFDCKCGHIATISIRSCRDESLGLGTNLNCYGVQTRGGIVGDEVAGTGRIAEQPKPQQELNSESLRHLPPPGGIIIFSGAQLHETVPNTTNVARYSIDFRTVHLDDVVGRRGAVNLDSRCTGTTMLGYICFADGRPLPEEIVKLYDDGTATSDKILRFGDRLVGTAAE
jgi:hypothetical protein